MTMITVPGTGTADLSAYTPVVLERDLQVQSVADYVPADAGLDPAPAPRLTVLTAPGSCVMCTATKRKLEESGIVSFDYRHPTDQEREHYGNLGYRQAPTVIDHATGNIWTGYNPVELGHVINQERAKLAA